MTTYARSRQTIRARLALARFAVAKAKAFDESKHPRDEDGQWTSKEETAQFLYAGTAYDLVNAKLRGDPLGDDPQTQGALAVVSDAGMSLDDIVENIDSAMSKSRVQEPTTVYRGVDSFLGDKFLAALNKKGKQFRVRGYMSTSVDQAVAVDFSSGVVLRFDLQPGQPALDLTAHSANPHERELLLPRGSIVSITGLESSSDVDGRRITVLRATIDPGIIRKAKALIVRLREILKAYDPKKLKGAAAYGGASGGKFDESKHNRHPKGTPDGGKFADKGGGSKFPGEDDGYGDLFGHYITDKYFKQPQQRPATAVPHPAGVDDKGKAVWIDKPTKASPPETWTDPRKVATFVPGGMAPSVLNGVAMQPWHAPVDAEGWAAVEGQVPGLDTQPIPSLVHSGNDKDGKPYTINKKPGTGLIVVEPDGRMWLTMPTNEFGGYKHTFPKGTLEPELPPQANAIKEAWEETGLKVEIIDVLGDFERTTSVARFYLAQRVGGTPSKMGWESQGVRLVPPHVLPHLLTHYADKPILEAFARRYSKGVMLKAYNPDQPRWPKGTPLGGQWIGVGDSGIILPPTIAGGKSNPQHQKKANAIYASAVAGDWKTLQEIMAGLDAKVLAIQGKASQNTHDKAALQLQQYLAKLLESQKAKPRALAAVAAAKGPLKLTDLTYVADKSTMGGSAPGGIFKDGAGKLWLVKGYGGDSLKAHGEVMASKMYAAAGVAVPDMRVIDLLGKYGGGHGVASALIEEKLRKIEFHNAGDLATAQKDFAAHVWLNNYDAIGLAFDNTLVGTKTGTVFQVDPGGSLQWKATVGEKEFGYDASKLWTSMRDPSVNGNAAKVFGGMTASQLAASAESVTKIDDVTIGKIVDAYMPGTAPLTKADFKAKLIARRDSLGKLVAASAGAQAAMSGATGGDWPALSGHVLLNGVTLSPEDWNSIAASINNLVANKSSDAMQGVVNGIDKKFTGSGADKVKDWINGKFAAMMYGQPTNTPAEPPAAVPEPAPAPSITTQSINVQVTQHHNTSEGHNKFWQAAVVGNNLVTQYGKIDSKGAQTIKPFPTVAAAMAAKSKLIMEKLDKGYYQVGTVDMTVTDVAIAEAPAAPPSPFATPPEPKDSVLPIVSIKPKAVDKPAEATSSKPVPTGLPDFDKFLIPETNTNAPSHNKQVKEIKAFAEAGNINGILGLRYGTNTYGKKRVILANDTLAALGSKDNVWIGLQKGQHPTLTGKQVVVELKEDTTKVSGYLQPITLPPKPDFLNWKGPGQGLSSSPHVNAQNAALADQIYALGIKGDEQALKAFTYQPIDKVTGSNVGAPVPISQHPAKDVKAFHKDVLDSLAEAKKPPPPPLPKITADLSTLFKDIKAQIPDAPKLTDLQHRAGRYGILAALADDTFSGWAPLAATQKPVNLDLNALYDASHKNYNALSSTERTAIKAYTGNAYTTMNNAQTGVGTHSQAGIAVSALSKAAVPLPTGVVLSRKFSFQNATDKATFLKSAQGKIIKDFGIISSSTNPAVWGGEFHLRIVAGEGAKGLFVAPKPSGGGSAISNYPGEKEIILPYGTHFYVSKIHPAGKSFTDAYGTWGGYGHVVDLVMLPG